MITKHMLSVLRYHIAYQTPCYFPYVITCDAATNRKVAGSIPDGIIGIFH